MYEGLSLHLREADELGTDTEAGTLTGSEANGRGEEVEDGEDHGGEKGEGADLTEHELLLGDDDGGNGHGEALNEILHDTRDDFTGKSLHFYI